MYGSLRPSQIALQIYQVRAEFENVVIRGRTFQVLQQQRYAIVNNEIIVVDDVNELSLGKFNTLVEVARHLFEIWHFCRKLVLVISPGTAGIAKEFFDRFAGCVVLGIVRDNQLNLVGRKIDRIQVAQQQFKPGIGMIADGKEWRILVDNHDAAG